MPSPRIFRSLLAVLATSSLLILPTQSASASELPAAFSALGSGSASPGSNPADVRALAYGPDGTLYAGGDFETMGGVTVNGIAKWDGTSWLALGTGLNTGTNGNVLAIAFDSAGNLYAGGDFTTAGGVAAAQIAKWDGTTWSALGSGTNGLVYDLEFVGADLYLGGNFTTAGGSSANYIAKWNGTSWSALGLGTNALVRSIESDGFGSLYVGGDFTTAGGTAAASIAKWNGSAWSNLISTGGTLDGTNGTVYSLKYTGNALYVGGNFTRAGDSTARSLAAWIPAWGIWNVPANVGVNYVVHALAPLNDVSLIAGGAFTATEGGEQLLRLGIWDGISQSQVGSGVPGTYLQDYVGVIVIAPDGSIVIGGRFSQAGGIAATNIARVRLLPPSSASWPFIVQGVPLNSQGTCDSIADSQFAYGTGLTGGWQRAWQVWITDSEGNRVGGWGCERFLRHNGTEWIITNQ